MRVLYFTRDYTPHDHRFLSALAETQHTIFSLRLERRGRQLEDRPLPPQVEQVQWNGGQRPVRLIEAPALLTDLERVIERVQPDVIHAGPIQSAALLAALSGFHPLVSMSWGSDLLRDADRNWKMRFVTRYTLSHTTVLAGDCEAVRRKAGEFGFPAERVVLFPWGVDLQRFSPGQASELRNRLGWEDAFVILSTRTWETLYGVDGVVKAFCQAAEREPRLRLMLLGGGSQAAMLRKMLAQHDLLDRVHFGGQISGDELPAYYRAADLYVSASHSDGSSVSLMEALASGLPALVSDIPGNHEWITPEENAGWLFADGDFNALAEGMLRAAAAPAGLNDQRQAARALAERRADWPKNFQQLLRAYELARELDDRKSQ
ncbi:glycosyltransferase [Longilinea arvoryzae]|uniref:Glycosyltransferase n=1 Tax=Longilinea arvoryzae TaxID=360412 RepID=A0A0S7BIT8_9CHLR|nr:glycosyltransferase [Longilinea arvoryzae]GAP13777.1 glycosyltransferase [Longilinea arvoryzae]